MHETMDAALAGLVWHAQRKAPVARIASRIMTLRGKTQDVATFLINNVDRLPHMTIEEIACACDTSRATILRMSNELGYNNFTELRKDLLESSGSISVGPAGGDMHRDGPTEAIKRCITMLLDTYSTVDVSALDKAVALLLNKAPIIVYGGAVSGGIARVIQNQFRKLGLTTYASSDVESIVQDMRQRNGMLFCVSHVGSAPNVMNVLRQAKQHQVPSVLLVNMHGSPACDESDVVLSTNITSCATDGYDVLARTSQLYLVELLCSEVAARLQSDAATGTLGFSAQ